GNVTDSIDNGPTMPYTRYFYPGLEASTTSTELQFGFFNPPSFWLLDDVSVELHVVKPQPDFNLDTHPDLVLYNSTTRQTAVWFLNNNSFIGSMYGPTLPSGWTVAGVGDFNRDGRADYALFNATTRQSAIWYLDETTFIGSAFGPTIASGYVLSGVADFDLNGAPDFLLFNPTTRQTAIWYLSNNFLAGGAFGPTPPAGWTVAVP